MNFILFVFAVLPVSLAASKVPGHGILEVPDIGTVHMNCQKIPANYVPDWIFKDIAKNYRKALELPNYPRHIDCMSRGLSFINDNNKLNAEGVRVQVLLTQPDKADLIVSDCVHDKATRWDSERILWECLFKYKVYKFMNPPSKPF